VLRVGRELQREFIEACRDDQGYAGDGHSDALEARPKYKIPLGHTYEVELLGFE
jgi:hypothetical protein